MLSIISPIATAFLNSIVAAADVGSGPAKLKIYDGTIPTLADTALQNNTLLATLICSEPCGIVQARTLTFNTIIEDSNVDTNGNASFFRLTDSDDNVIIQGNISTSTGNGNLKLSTIALVATGTTAISSAIISVP